MTSQFKPTAAQLKVVEFMEQMPTLLHEDDVREGRFRRAVVNKMTRDGMLVREDEGDAAVWSLSAAFARWRNVTAAEAAAIVRQTVAAPGETGAAEQRESEMKPTPATDLNAPVEVQQIPVVLVRAGENDRKHFDERALRELADSIAAHGLAQPITLRTITGSNEYEIVAGERRFRAISQVLGWDTVPAIVRDLSDEDAAALMLVENTSRVDLDPIAEANAFRVRRDRFGWDDARIAKTAGVSVERVRNRLALLTIAPDLHHWIKIGSFPIGHAQEIVDLDTDRQRIAVRAFNSAKSMPLPRFKEIVAKLREDAIAESQQSLFELELVVMQDVGSEQSALRGKHARTGAPTRMDLPPLRFAMTDTVGDLLDRFVMDLRNAGLDGEAAVVGTVYTALVATNFASVPVTSPMAKIALPDETAERMVRIAKL